MRDSDQAAILFREFTEDFVLPAEIEDVQYRLAAEGRDRGTCDVCRAPADFDFEWIRLGERGAPPSMSQRAMEEGPYGTEYEIEVNTTICAGHVKDAFEDMDIGGHQGWVEITVHPDAED